MHFYEILPFFARFTHVPKIAIHCIILWISPTGSACFKPYPYVWELSGTAQTAPNQFWQEIWVQEHKDCDGHVRHSEISPDHTPYTCLET